jgi:hypothetical protein
MTATLFGNDSVTLAVDVPPALRGTPVLFLEASALRHPRGARVYVDVYLVGADRRERELGNFTFFGATRDADKQVFAFPLEAAAEREVKTSRGALVRASMKPFDENDSDVLDVRVELRAWIEVR